MRRNIIFIITLALFMSSCEYELDFSGDDKTRRLFVLGIPGSSDTTVVRLHSTIPTGDRNSCPLPLDDARVSLFVNGDEVVMDRADETVPSLPEGSFYTLYPVKPGDKVEVRASAEGAEPVWAESSVPELFPESEVVMDVERNSYGSPDGLTFSARFKDDPDVENYYGIQVLLRRERYSYTIESGYTIDGYEYELADSWRYSDSENALYPFQKPMIVSYKSGIDIFVSYGSNAMLVYNDRAFENGEGYIEFLAKYEEDRVEVGTWLNGVLQDEKGYRCSYKVLLYRLSPELYNFIRADSILYGNISILIAAAPPSYVYTNIRGGVGVFGGISVTETDWIPNVKYENN